MNVVDIIAKIISNQYVHGNKSLTAYIYRMLTKILFTH